MLNVEFKSELRSPEIARAALESIGASYEGSFRQIDTYYRVPTGRLKKRDTPGKATEYISYQRADRSSPKLSRYEILDTQTFLERYGELPLPVLVTVDKERELLWLGNVRVHLDRVEGLGRFLELEAIVGPAHSVERCHEIVADVRARLGPSIGEPISCSYSDLLLGNATGE